MFLIFQGGIFRFHVSFQGGSSCLPLIFHRYQPPKTHHWYLSMSNVFFACVPWCWLLSQSVRTKLIAQKSSLWGNGWLSVAILTRLSAIAKFVCKAACAPSLYVAYCLLGSLVLNDSWRFFWIGILRNLLEFVAWFGFLFGFLNGLLQHIGYWHLKIPAWDHRPIWRNVGWPTCKTLTCRMTWEILKDLKDTYKSIVLLVGNLMIFVYICVFLVDL